MENTEASKAFPKQVFLHNWFSTSNMAQSEWTLKAYIVACMQKTLHLHMTADSNSAIILYQCWLS